MDDGPACKVYAAPRSGDGRPGGRRRERERRRGDRHRTAGETEHIDTPSEKKMNGEKERRGRNSWMAACRFALSCVDGCAAVLLACVYALMCCWASMQWPVGCSWRGTVWAETRWAWATEVGLVSTAKLEWKVPAPGLAVGEDQSAGPGQKVKEKWEKRWETNRAARHPPPHQNTLLLIPPHPFNLFTSLTPLGP